MAEATTAQPNTTGTPVGAPTGTGTPADWTQFITSIISTLSGTGVLGNQGDLTKIAQMSDPWGSHRAQYQDQLDAFMKDPSSVLKDPAFQAAEKLGAENISRQAGAAGMAQSGNRLADLFKFGETSALDFEKTKFNELSQLAGVNAGDPGAVARMLLGLKTTQGTNLTTGLAGLGGVLIPAILRMLGIGSGDGGGGGGGNTTLPWGAPDQGSFDLTNVGLDPGLGVDTGPPDLSNLGDVLSGF